MAKMKLELDEEEIIQAIREYVCDQYGCVNKDTEVVIDVDADLVGNPIVRSIVEYKKPKGK